MEVDVWATSRSGHFTPGERARSTHWIGCWVYLRAGLDDLEKRTFSTLPGLDSDPSVIQPIASRYTDYAIPAPILTLVYVICCAWNFLH
jgi:hypothetical protein